MSQPSPPLDREAKRRLAIIRHVEEVTGNVALTCRYYGISRQAYYIWYRRYLAEGIDGLRTRSRGAAGQPAWSGRRTRRHPRLDQIVVKLGTWCRGEPLNEVIARLKFLVQ
ncbi:MAG TPA: helix-turn-helix domain-containing protein [Nonomuraea sp.]|nr:helix-turn-helix domain-containing protein [Nonomuraea sp.]